MKSKEQIVKLIDELYLNQDQQNEAQMDTIYINKGWIEALKWVIKEEEPRLVVTPDLQVKVE
tara:strand:- start:282 stop:467 length:186 start_codon:yes stop_codon:yes gene_type:complete